MIAPVTISQMQFGYYMQIPFMKRMHKAKLKSPVKTEVVIKMMLTEPTPTLRSQPAKTSLTLKSIFSHRFIEQKRKIAQKHTGCFSHLKYDSPNNF